MVWAPDLVSKEGNKKVPSWLGPYIVERELSKVSYSLPSEIGKISARVHSNQYQAHLEGGRPDSVCEGRGPSGRAEATGRDYCW